MNSTNGYMIIGVDPGLMTGFYLHRTYEANHTEVPQGPVQAEAGRVPHLMRDWISRVNSHMWHDDEGTEEPHGVHIAVEKYIITPRTAKLTQQTDALEVTGMVKAVASLEGVEVKQYVKGNIQKLASDDALKRIGWYTPGMGHANDAARQAFYHLWTLNPRAWRRVYDGDSTIDTMEDD